MKANLLKIFFGLVLIAANGQFVQAEDLQPWQKELNEFSQKVPNLSNFGLRVNHAVYYGATITACSLSGALVAAQFAADSLPLVNSIAEILPNAYNDQYISITSESVLSRDSLDLITRGAVGGAGLTLYESLEFVFYWLAGDTDKVYSATKKMYESTITTMNTLFADKAKCLMSAAKFRIASEELSKRRQAGIDVLNAEPGSDELPFDGTMIIAP